MGILSILVAAAGAWLFGAAWYMALARPWMAVSGVRTDAEGKPANGGDPTPFILSAVAMIVVSGMMRHVFAMSGIATFGAGVVAGLGVGAFLITPWILINNAYPGRPYMLTVIDGGYAIFGCAVIGGILTLF